MSSNRENRFGTIIQIGDILVSEEVVTEYFACDYPVCKGCCCIIGDSGAPLEEAEVDELEKHYPEYSGLMRQQGKDQVDKDGFFIIDRDGDIVTPVVDGTGECAYTTFDGEGNCFCSIEKCYFAGTCSFRKPRSCWLYPIRVTKLRNGCQALNLHRWHLCKDAYEKGKREGIRVYEFLRDPLTTLYGKDFYDALCAAAAHING
ncbi:MAG: DUF3109 family protein [Bacteroidales bacterium]|nr:DUF3109 family protein [Bacteroidales bacterium]